MVKIGIIGHGFVGKAVERAFENASIFIVDPKYNTKVTDLTDFEPNVTFICVPTPSNDDGSVNTSIVLESIVNTLSFTYSMVVVKSTVPPSFAEQFKNNERVVFNPEFLTERNAIEDMIWANRVILGGLPESAKTIHYYYLKYSICSASEYVYVTAEEACYIKYISNYMIAAKVAILNELNSLFVDKQSWSKIVNVLRKDSRLGDSHWLVPGLDGKRGFGGACLPKDTNAFLLEAPNLTILKTVIESNNHLRNLYEPDARELQQNIKF